MRFNVISNLKNGVGLQQDYLLLRQELEARGHEARGVQFNSKPMVVGKADVNIFLEVVNPVVFPYAPIQWAVPNPEWWFAGWDAHPWDLILAKTRDTERIFRNKFGDIVRYIGWTARDMYNPDVPRQERFIHVAGKSRFKNTLAVVEGARMAGVKVTVIGENQGQQIRRRVTDEILAELMNTCFCHVMPSAYEGYGQVLHEALAVGQIVITTDAPPMNEIVPSILVRSVSTRAHHAGLLHTVAPSDVKAAIHRVLAMTPMERESYAKASRQQYQDNVRAFQQALTDLVGAG